mmetsp:Transcript_38140/g.101623  ORF Transcript_38140/g.101623 Transcript_38140/m.101623 type:complete len:97 (+) Transcript_38140:854-1144(+)
MWYFVGIALKWQGDNASMSSKIKTSGVDLRKDILYGNPLLAEETPSMKAANTFSLFVMGVSTKLSPHELHTVIVKAQGFPQLQTFTSLYKHGVISG